ncbi:MAG: hypothetical protein P8046_07240 [Anaerolineales bacterium]|jgi:hypothetical protein
MMDVQLILVDGAIFSLIGAVYLVGMLMIDNRMFLNEGDYPDDVLAAVPPRTPEETKKAWWLGLPYFAWSFGFPLYSGFRFVQGAGAGVRFGAVVVHIFLVLMSFWLLDLVVLDGIMFCWITPKFVVIPGTEGFAGYKDFGMHLRGHFYKGLPMLMATSIALAGIVWLII